MCVFILNKNSPYDGNICSFHASNTKKNNNNKQTMENNEKCTENSCSSVCKTRKSTACILHVCVCYSFAGRDRTHAHHLSTSSKFIKSTTYTFLRNQPNKCHYQVKEIVNSLYSLVHTKRMYE